MDEQEKTAAQDLDALFVAARAEPLRPSAELTSRILADAAQVQAWQAQTAAAENPVHRGLNRGLRHLWQQFQASIGGWPAVGGLAAASAAGLWIGLAPPDFLPDPAQIAGALADGQSDLTYETYDLALLLEEEGQ